MSIASVAFASEDEAELPIELRQLRYFVRAVELGSIRRAAAELGIATGSLTQDLARLEAQLTTRLFRRTHGGLVPTDAGVAFLRHAQLTLQHAVDAVEAARQQRLVGHVSVGLPPSTASVLGVPFMIAMRERHPQLRVHLVEALSGHLATMLDARQLDLALVARGNATRRWRASPLIDERVYLLGRADLAELPSNDTVSLAKLGDLPLIMPSGSHGLRSLLDFAFGRAGVEPRIAYEIDGLALLMDAVSAGLGATLQPGCVVATRVGASASQAGAQQRDAAIEASPSDRPFAPAHTLRAILIADSDARRQTMIASPGADEVSPAALAARVVIHDVTRELALAGRWPGTTFHELNSGNEES